MLKASDESSQVGSSGLSVRGDERRDAIIEAAALLFRRRGYPDVGIDDIGASAGISGPALYRYFDGKHDLFEAVVRGYIEDLNAAWTRVQASQSSDVLAAIISSAVRNPNGYAVYAWQHSYLDEQSWQKIAAVRRPAREAWAEHLASKGVPRTGADGRLRLVALQGVLTHIGLSRRASRTVRVSVAHGMGDRILSTPIPPSPPSISADELQTPLKHVGKREAILAVAVKKFSQQGFASVTLRDLGQEVGITASAVSRHFSTKESILAAAIDRAAEQAAAAIATSLMHCPTPVSAVRDFIRRYCTLVVENSDVFNVNARLLGSLSPTHQRMGMRRRRANVDELGAKVFDSIEDLTLAEARIRAGSVFSMANQVVSQPDLLSRPALVDELTTLCTGALGPQFS